MADILNGSDVLAAVLDGTFADGNVNVGIDDTQYGTVTIYGDGTGSTQGGAIRLHTAADHDAVFNNFSIDVTSTTLNIGPDDDSDILRLVANTGNVAASQLIFEGYQFILGQDNGVFGGVLAIYGQATGSNNGGAISLFTGEDHDDTINFYQVKVNQDDFVISAAGVTGNLLVYDGGTNQWVFSPASGIVQNFSLTSGTEEALSIVGTGSGGDQLTGLNVDFTGLSVNGGTYGFYIDGETTNYLSGNLTIAGGDIETGLEGGPNGNITLRGSGTGVVFGGSVTLHLADDHDTTISTYNISANEDDLYIGPNTDTDALIYSGGNSRWEFTGTVIGVSNYVDRGDPSSADYTVGSFTTNGAFHDLDLSSIVPAGATMVHLRCRIADDATGTYFFLREKGNSNSVNISIMRTLVTSVIHEHSDVWVTLDANRVIEYQASNTTISTLEVTVRGWLI